jgi:LAS superfamily LD-carboxypeptidase LdcB
MLAAAPGAINIKSGKRDRAHQERLWQEALQKYGNEREARRWVARPGHSRHEWGIAADLGYADDALRQWAHQNAAQFGLHFPLSNEPWHIELLGSR